MTNIPATARAYLIGGGIGSLAAAAFMIRDGGVPGALKKVRNMRAK